MAGQRNSHGKRPHLQTEYSDRGRNKRRNNSESDRGQNSIGSDDTVYRYLCPSKKIGSIMGRGGEIVKQLRSETKAKIRIGETVSGCDERVVTIHSTSDETNDFDGSDERLCPSMDALFKVHDRVVVEDQSDDDDDSMDTVQVTVRLLVPADQIGCCIGKGGQIIQNIRTDTGAQVRIMKDNHMPACALASDEMVQITGEASNVRKALFLVAARLHDNPSRSQHLLSSSTPNAVPSSGSFMGAAPGGPLMGLTPLVGGLGAYGGYKGEGGEWPPRSYYPAPRNESSPKEFSLRLICPTSNLGSLIGKGGSAINQIRQETGATIKVDSSKTEGDDCLVTISANELFEDTFSPTIEAAIRLQPKCSERVERDSGLVSYTTRLLVPNSRVGCLIGKGGAIITEIRRISKSNVRILSKDDVPKIADRDDEMMQISAELDLAKVALLQVTSRLRGDLFEREGVMSTFVPVVPYLQMPPDVNDVSKYDHRDSKSHGRARSYDSDLPLNDGYGSYGGLHGRSGGDAYGAYGSYSSARSGSSGGSRYNPSSRRRDYNY
ncbi:KH domain-containing protein At4g18375-like [Rutidosis leptorrhynchoides]|uniref:KH domain-containing protein At4g18375-like n=1 Tax=Rutidosis leptorrhynchoides TaxID=125765 RepID=UPI003A9A15E6